MIEALSEEIEQLLKDFAGIADETALSCERELDAELKDLGAALYCLLGLFLPALDRWARQKQEVIWRHAAPKRASPSFVFVGLLANMINSVLASRHLIVIGMDRQARAIFRELTEVGDLLLVIVADEATLDTYLASPEEFDDAYGHWNTHLKPSKIRKQVQAMSKKNGFDKLWADPDAVWRSRWELYAWLSKFAHVDYATLVVESLAADQNDRYNINIGGRFGPRTAMTLQHMVDYLRGTLALLSLFLAATHGWTKLGPDLRDPLLVIRAFVQSGEKTASAPEA